MIWTENTSDRKFRVLRLNSPKAEKIRLDFEPLKMSDKPNWNPMWEEWHCYLEPLRIYREDYEILLCYFNRIYPIKDAFDRTHEPIFDVCFDNWIGKEDWYRIISEIENDLDDLGENTKGFLADFLDWLKNALKHTSIIVVEGNL
ncbi:MAG: BdrN protein [Oscillospiraceae bacterium]|nr:BdrN protein [Oscillospiraceae bacterium]